MLAKQIKPSLSVPKFTVDRKCKEEQYRDSQMVWKKDGSHPGHVCVAWHSTIPSSSCTRLFIPQKLSRAKPNPPGPVLPHETTSNSILHCKQTPGQKSVDIPLIWPGQSQNACITPIRIRTLFHRTLR